MKNFMPLTSGTLSNHAPSGSAGEVTGGKEMDFHFPSGQDSVAMRSFAHVEHPHLRQRPEAFSAAASHSGQARQVASRAARMSGGVVEKPEAVNFFPAKKAARASSNLALTSGGSFSKKSSRVMIL